MHARALQKYIQSLVNTSVGKCEIKEFYKEDAMAVIFKAHHSELNKHVLLKILHPSPGVDYLMARYKKVIDLNHPNILKVYDIQFLDKLEKYCIIEEGNDAMLLSEFLTQEGTCALEDAIRMTLDVARGLAYSHSQGVVHGNVVPSNMLYYGYQHPAQIMNFCLPPIYKPPNKTTSQPIMGTLGYVPPEIIKGEPPNFSTDVYNLGACFLQFLTGKIPFSCQETLDFGPTMVYSPPNWEPPAETPAPVLELLQNMLAADIDKRPQKAGDLISTLEELLNRFNKVRCPRCGKKNVPKEVFRCQHCQAENLCLTHLVVEEQRCDRCVEIVKGSATQKVIKPSDKNRMKLSAFLSHLSHAGKKGVIVLGTKLNVLGFNIQEADVEVCLEKTNPEKVYQNYAGSPTPSPEAIPALHERAIRANIAKVLEWKEFAFEFYENGKVERLIPQNNTRLSASVPAENFLNTFSQILEIVNDANSVGGMAIESAKQSAGFLFMEKGVLVVSPAPGEEKQCQVLHDPKTIENLIRDILSSGVTKLEYRSPSVFPSIKTRTIPIPTSNFLESFVNVTSWDVLGHLMPKAEDILPPTQNWDYPFGGIDLSQIGTIVTQNLKRFLNVEELSQSLGLSALNTFLLAMGVVKEKLCETGTMLLDMIGNYGEKWGHENSATVLAEAQKLCPDVPEIPSFLAKIYSVKRETKKASACFLAVANIHWMMQDFGLAMQFYERACQLDSELILPKVRLLELYEKLDQKEKIRSIGLALFNTLKPKAASNLELMEKVCNTLLKLDETQMMYRKELIKICMTKNDKASAISHYEVLLKQHSRDRDAKIRYMATILSLDKSRKDLLEKLEKMGAKAWKKAADKLEKYPLVSLQSLGGKLPFKKIKEKAPKIIGVGLALAVVYVLVSTLIGVIFSPSQPVPVNKPAVQNPPTDPKIEQERQLLSAWTQKFDKIKAYQKDRDWKKASLFCKEVREEFGKTALAKTVDEACQKAQTEIAKQWEEEMDGLWKGAESLRSQKKLKEAQEEYKKIADRGNETWQARAKATMQELKEEIDREELETKDVEKLYQIGLGKKQEGLFKDALTIFDRIERLYPDSPRITAIQKLRKQIEELKKTAQNFFNQAVNLEKENKYEEAVEIYQKILQSSSFQHTDVAKEIKLPLVIETVPVVAQCFIDEKEIGKAPLVFKYSPSQFPKIRVSRKCFEEEKRSFSKTLSDDIWKLTIQMKYKPLWQFPMGSPIESPLFVEGSTVYVASRNGHLFALSSQGEKKWDFYAGPLTDISGGIAADENSLYLGSHKGDFYAIDKKSGEPRWEFSSGSAIKSTPVLCEEEICFTTENGHLWFLTRQGKESARLELGNSCDSSPWYYKKTIFTGTLQKLYAISVPSKKVLWQITLDAHLCAGPILHGKYLYYTTSDLKVNKILVNKKSLWQTSIPNTTSALLATDSHVFVGDDKGILHCLDSKDGKILWEKDTKQNPKEIAPIDHTVFFRKDRIFVANMGRRLMALSTTDGKPTWEYQSERNFSCTPAFQDDILFMGDEKGYVFAFDTGHLWE